MGALNNVKLTGQNAIITHGKGRRTPEITSSTHRFKQKQWLSVSPYSQPSNVSLKRNAFSINNKNMVSIQLKIHNLNTVWQLNLLRPWIQLYDIDDLTGYFNHIKPHPELYFPIIINLHTLVAIYLVLDWLLGVVAVLRQGLMQPRLDRSKCILEEDLDLTSCLPLLELQHVPPWSAAPISFQ